MNALFTNPILDLVTVMRNYLASLILVACLLVQTASFADTIDLTIDASQSSGTIEVAGASDTSSASGTGQIVLQPPSVPFGTAQVTEMEIVLDDGFEISFLGGFVSISADPGDVVTTLQTVGAPGQVGANNQFSQFGSTTTSTGIIEVFDPFGLAGGTQTIDLATLPPGPFNLMDAQLSVAGNVLTMSAEFAVTFEVAAGIEATIGGMLVTTGIIPVALDVTALNVFRGMPLSGGLTELADSDDSFAQFNPGFTLTSLEAPVWLEFDATLPDDSPASLAFQIESNVNTPGLDYTIELFNFDTSSYEVMGQELGPFNVDTVFGINASGDLNRFTEDGTGVVRSRVGWRRVGFTLVFPWQVNIDQVTFFSAND